MRKLARRSVKLADGERAAAGVWGARGGEGGAAGCGGHGSAGRRPY